MGDINYVWVKNVNNMFRYQGIIGDYISPFVSISLLVSLVYVEKLVTIHNFTLSFFTYFYTAIFTKLPLLKSSYPHNPQYLLLTQQNKFKER